MQNQINFSLVLEHYSNMSEGDKSCVTAMLQNPEAQQMTSIGKPRDKFYKELSKSGWTKSVDIPKNDQKQLSLLPAILKDEHDRQFKADKNI